MFYARQILSQKFGKIKQYFVNSLYLCGFLRKNAEKSPGKFRGVRSRMDGKGYFKDILGKEIIAVVLLDAMENAARVGRHFFLMKCL